jgi:hypothetical protein
MFFNHHEPPLFHARYGEFEATIEIGTGRILEGTLPRRALSLVPEWGDDAYGGVARSLAAVSRQGGARTH